EEVIRSLDAGHAADPADGERVGRDAEDAAGLGAAVRRGMDAIFELDPEPDHRELLFRRDPESYEVVAHLRADRDQARRPIGEPALERAEHPRPQRAEVAAQHVAVER